MSRPDLGGPRVLFVNHASRAAGAELILLDVVQAFQGASAFLFEDGPLRPALAARGVTPIWPSKDAGFASIKRDRSLLRALPHLGGLVKMALRIAAVARRHQVVYANSQKAFALAAPAAALARRPLIWHLHDILSPAHFGKGQRRLTVALANRWAARVIVPSHAAAAAFVAAGGIRERLRIIPNGLDRDPPDDDAAECLLPHPFIFGVFSRLAPWKGQDVAIRALAELPDVGCVIAGSALFGEDEYARWLPKLAAELGVADRVRFLGQRDDVPALMTRVDAVVHPSTDPEPFGRTLVEAMLARRPVVAADAGAVPEILDGGRVGTLFTPGDAISLATALRQVRSGAGAALLDSAEARARSLYSAARMRAEIRQVVADVAPGLS